MAYPYSNAPWSFVALVGYEEAAHAFAFSFTLLSVTAAWRNKWVLSSLLAAVVFLTNWPAVIGLVLMLVALGLARARDFGFATSGLRIVGVLGTGYGMAAFWITPGYFVSSSLLNRIVITHTNPTHPWSWTTTLILISATVLIGISFWKRVSPANTLVLSWIAVLGAVVTSYSLAGSWLVPMPNRYMLEFNAVCVLAIAGLISIVPAKWRVATVAVAAALGVVLSIGFLTKAWSVQPRSVDAASLISFQIASWLKQHAGNSRVLGSGELDTTLALWSDVPQAGGTGQDVSNFLMFAAQRQVAFGCGPDSGNVAIAWLRAMNANYFVVHGAQSREAFHWYSRPEKYKDWPVAWDNGAGDLVYGPLSQQDAVVVDLAALRALPSLHSTDDRQFLNDYVKWAAGKRPAKLQWQADDRAVLDVTLGPDEGVLVKTNYDSGWKISGGNLTADPIGFLLIRNASGQQTLKLQFGASWDVWLGKGIALATVILLLLRIAMPLIAVVCLIPTIIAYGILMHAVPFSAQISEEAFTRLQPALISTGGVVDSITNSGPPFARGRMLTMYGINFGSGNDRVVVSLGSRDAAITYHGPNVIAFKLPQDIGPLVDVSVEVNGCRGNEFRFATR